MMGSLKNHRGEQVPVSVEVLVSLNHFLRMIEVTIEFIFIEEKLVLYYFKDNERPSIHPIILFKMMFIGYLYGIRSERQLAQELEANVAYRCFLGLSFMDKVSHHSRISFNRRTSFLHTMIFEDIFDEIVRQAIEH
ncbi:transposase [Bacillus aryabhattai]|uniref:Transposase n=1 Tax=Priestia aryabhattai TaxID=412384 RepID=A0A7W3REH4_PRIAR|nr:transposase [Priestia aryabhattai]